MKKVFLSLTALTILTVIVTIMGIKAKTAIILLLFFFVIFYVIIKLRLSPFHAVTLYLLSFVLYSFLPYISFILTGRTTFVRGIEYTTETLLVSFVLFTLALCGFLLGYTHPLGKRLGERLPIFPKNSLFIRRWFTVSLVTILFGLSSVLVLIKLFGGLGSFLSLPYPVRHLKMRGLGYLSIGMYFVNLGIFFLLVLLIEGKLPDKLKLPILLFLAFYFYSFFLAGWRHPVAFLVMMTLSYYHFRKKSLSWRIVSIVGTVGILAFLVWGALRSLTFTKAFQLIFVNSRLVWLDPSTSEFGSAPSVITLILKNLEFESLRLGATYLEAWLQLIPKVIFPRRPITPSEWLVAQYFPDLFRRGGGLGFSYIAEAYLNFWFFGPLIVSWIFGIAVRALDVYRERGGVTTTLIFSISLPWILWAFRSDLITILKLYLVGQLLPTLIALSYASNWRISRRRL
jgi:oligosaccharide repeat unit polymerase